MEWVKLKSTYYLDDALMRAGEDAEVLFLRALAYAADQETEGFISTETASRLTPKRHANRALALVREGLWVPIEGGWVIRSWAKWGRSKDQIEAGREGNRARQSRYRARKQASVTQDRNGVTNGVSNAPREEERREEDAAAAASGVTPTVTDGHLRPALAILKARLDAAKLPVRWDTLTAEQADAIEGHIAVHGDARLVKAAMNAYQANHPPVFAQAWLGTWAALPAPGARPLGLVEPPCPEPGHSGSARHCIQCASERLVEGGAR